MNKKGFFMMETLAVIVFCAGIFTFLYVSVLPLIGTYNDLIIRESNIDIVYKLYNIRLAIQKDNKLKNDLSSDNFTQISCSGEDNDNIKKFKDENYCNNLMTQMELTNYNLFYTDSIKNNIESFSSYTEVYKYLDKYKEEDNPTLILIDNKEHTIAHLDYYEINPSVSMADLILKKVPKTGTCSNIIYEEDGIKYFSGTNTCVNFNYVWYSGKLWRITAIYPDGAMKLITENNITSIAFNENGQINFYTDENTTSYMYQWLNEDFYDTLYNAEELIDTTKKWNATGTNKDTAKPSETTMVSANVGLVNSREYYNNYRCTLSSNCNSTSITSGYMYSSYDGWLLNPHMSSYNRVTDASRYYISGPSSVYGVRPSIYLKSEVKFTGSGTVDSPYKIEGDKETGRANDLINTRLSGEYVKLKNGSIEQVFRIIGVEDNKTKIIAMDYADNKGNRQFATSENDTLWGSGTTIDADTWYDYLNNTYLPNLKNNYGELFTSGTYYLGTSGYNYKLSVCANTTSGSTKGCAKTSVVGTFNIGLPRYGEMFATNQGGRFSASINMRLMNRYSASRVWHLNAYGNADYSDTTKTGVARPTLHLKSTVKIKSGSGTQNDPYVVGL